MSANAPAASTLSRQNLDEFCSVLTPSQADLARKMAACEQSPGYSTLQHGWDCANNYDRLTHLIAQGRFHEPDWRLPEWIVDYGQEVYRNLHDVDTAERYIIFHDCGKWACLEKDAEGRRHFPNHAEVSKQTFEQHFDDPAAAKLVGFDMALHTMKDADIDGYLSQWSVQDACTLLLASLAEIHANAAMFGGEKGIDSTSFKIKFKQIAKRGKAICQRLFGEKP